jgi:hypothetical protein
MPQRMMSRLVWLVANDHTFTYCRDDVNMMHTGNQNIRLQPYDQANPIDASAVTISFWAFSF